MAEPSATFDSFHRGAFSAYQPVGRGHRAGSDALLLAASLPPDAAGRLADLGAGSGVAGLGALSMNRLLAVTLVEIDAEMADLARRTLAHPANAAISGRAEVLMADVSLSGRKRQEAGLTPDTFDYVVMNPPYYGAAQRRSPDPQRALAHNMATDAIDDWIRTAAAILRPSGLLSVIYRTEYLQALLQALHRRFGQIEILPLHPRSAAPADRVIVRCRKGSRAPLSLRAGLVLHGDDGRPTPCGEAAVNGRINLFEGKARCPSQDGAGA